MHFLKYNLGVPWMKNIYIYRGLRPKQFRNHRSKQAQLWWIGSKTGSCDSIHKCLKQPDSQVPSSGATSCVWTHPPSFNIAKANWTLSAYQQCCYSIQSLGKTRTSRDLCQCDFVHEHRFRGQRGVRRCVFVSVQAFIHLWLDTQISPEPQWGKNIMMTIIN